MDARASKLTEGEPVTEPKKYVGYKEFARFVSSDDDFFALRRFDRTHCRALLALQDEIHILEERLDALDHSLSTREPVCSNNGTFRNDPCPERKEILDELVSRLGIYDNLLSAYIGLKKASPAASLAVKNIRTWLYNQSEPIDTAETQFLNAPDLISFGCRRKAFFRRLLEEHVLARLVRVARSASARISGTRGRQGKHAPDGVTSRPGIPDGGTSWSDVPDGVTSWQDVPDGVTSGPDEHTDIAANFSVFLAAVCMLIAPLWILPPMGNQLDKKLGAITAFLLLFLVFMQWGTIARPFEVLAATAGYAAVLVVFLQASA